MPFYLSSRGYGVLVNEAGPAVFEGRVRKRPPACSSAARASLDYCVFAGPTPKDVISRSPALTGARRCRRPGPLACGSTSFTTQYDEATVTHFIDRDGRRDMPLAVFHFDCFWMREFQWCDLSGTQGFPEAEAMLKRLRDKGPTYFALD